MRGYLVKEKQKGGCVFVCVRLECGFRKVRVNVERVCQVGKLLVQ